MKKLLHILILLFVILTVTVYAQQTYEEYFNLANKAFMKGEYNNAQNFLHSAEMSATTIREIAAVKNASGWIYYNAGDYQKARNNLLESLKKSIESEDAKLAQKASNNLGLIEYSQGNLEEAKKYFSNQWSSESDTSVTYLLNIKQQEEKQKAKYIHC